MSDAMVDWSKRLRPDADGTMHHPSVRSLDLAQTIDFGCGCCSLHSREAIELMIAFAVDAEVMAWRRLLMKNLPDQARDIDDIMDRVRGNPEEPK